MITALRKNTFLTTLIGVGLLYIALSTIIFKWYDHQINPDGVAYISIAAHYLQGHFAEAVNAYWSPLFSWILIPFLATGLEAVTAAKLSLLAAGLANVSLVMAIAWRLSSANIRTITTVVIGLAASVVTLAWALPGPTTPDILYSAIFLGLILLLLQENKSLWWFIAIGCLCGLLFLAKAVGLYVGLLVFIGLALKNLQHKEKLRLIGVSILTALAITAPFVAAISSKYGHFTIGSSSNYNLQLVAPESSGHPMLRELLPPPHKYAITAWEDASTIAIGNWRPSINDAAFLLKNAGKNMWQSVQIIQTASILSLPLAAATVFLWCRRFWIKRTARDGSVHMLNPWQLAIITGATLASILPYVALFTEERYLYHLLLLLLVGFGALLSHLPLNKGVVVAVVGLFAVSWLYHPTMQLQQNKRIHSNYYTDSQSFAGKIPRGSKVASSTFASLYFCFYTRTICYSSLPADTSKALRQLREYGVQYVLLYPNDFDRLKQNLTLQPVAGNATYFDMHLYQIIGD